MIRTLTDIFISEKMEMPNIHGLKRVQRFNFDFSVNFIFDDESRDFKEKLTN